MSSPSGVRQSIPPSSFQLDPLMLTPEHILRACNYGHPASAFSEDNPHCSHVMFVTPRELLYDCLAFLARSPSPFSQIQLQAQPQAPHHPHPNQPQPHPPHHHPSTPSHDHPTLPSGGLLARAGGLRVHPPGGLGAAGGPCGRP